MQGTDTSLCSSALANTCRTVGRDSFTRVTWLVWWRDVLIWCFGTALFSCQFVRRLVHTCDMTHTRDRCADVFLAEKLRFSTSIAPPLKLRCADMFLTEKLRFSTSIAPPLKLRCADVFVAEQQPSQRQCAHCLMISTCIAPPLRNMRWYLLLQNIVCFIGLFCKRDLWFNRIY